MTVFHRCTAAIDGPGNSSNQMTRKCDIATRLPVRRGLDAQEAAVYLSLSPSFFRQLVQEGLMPRPRVIKGRRIWDIEELDIAFKAMPREGGEHNDTVDTWADFK
jgi:excisionase family DNA binding protein